VTRSFLSLLWLPHILSFSDSMYDVVRFPV
jgi:hypothetical protein